jgi:predicted metal-dependent hydrolase
MRVSEERAVEFLKIKMPWVEKHLNLISEQEPVNLEKKYSHGEEHYFLGEKYILEVVVGDIQKVVVLEDKVRVYQFESGDKITERIYLKWLDTEIERIFRERYKIVLAKFGYINVPRLQFKSMKRRWGSYRSTGYISLNKRLIHAPVECIDYVITHELCHHKHMNHGRGFYNLLESKLPNWKEEEKILKRYGKLTCL